FPARSRPAVRPQSWLARPSPRNCPLDTFPAIRAIGRRSRAASPRRERTDTQSETETDSERGAFDLPQVIYELHESARTRLHSCLFVQFVDHFNKLRVSTSRARANSGCQVISGEPLARQSRSFSRVFIAM